MYQAPSADQLSKNLRQAVEAEIPGSDPFIWPNNLYVVLKVFAQALRGLYLRLQWIHQQAFVSTAEGDYLDLHAVQAGQTRQPATFAAGNIGGSGGTVDVVVPAGTRFTRSDGAAFDTGADATFAADGTVTIQLVAEVAGKAANTVPGATLTPEAPIDGNPAFAVDDSGLNGGNDLENDASLRARLLNLKQNPPRGGSPSEYIGWARAKAGVTRVFVQRATPAAGHVTIVFMMDDQYPNEAPPDSDAADLLSILEGEGPGDAKIHVQAPDAVPVDVTISAIYPDTPAVKAAVSAELTAMFRRRAVPGSATTDSVFSKSWISEAVANADGEISHDLVAPSADITLGVNSAGVPELAVLGVLTFD